VALEKFICTDRVRNEEGSGVKEEEMNIIQINIRKANWLVTCCVGTAF